MKIDFNDTEIAFRGKNAKDLQRAYLLFKLVANPALVNYGSKITNLALKLGFPIQSLVKSTIFNQFCGGESIEECEGCISYLSEQNVGTILDYSLEGKESDADLDETTLEIIRTIQRASADERIPFSVFKPTGIGRFSLLEKSNSGMDALNESEKLDYEKLRKRMHRICAEASRLKVPVFIDAEDSWIQDAIDRLAEEMMSDYNREEVIVYTTVQMYRWDRLAYLKQLHEQGKNIGFKIGYKIVRGAYMEKERQRAAEKGFKDPIQPTKEATDTDYNKALEYCLDNLNDISICAGSHNEESALYLADLMLKKGVATNDKRVYFAQLLGMSDHISFNLSNANYQVAKYVPYGPVKEVMPYLMRRAQENTSVAGQTGRELSLIVREIERRKRIKA
jgi:proline dehydrogenase